MDYKILNALKTGLSADIWHLKHFRTHNEIFSNIYEPKPLSDRLRKVLFNCDVS